MTLKKVTQRLSDRFASAFRYACCPDLHEHDLRHEATCRWLELRDANGQWMFRLEDSITWTRDMKSVLAALNFRTNLASTF